MINTKLEIKNIFFYINKCEINQLIIIKLNICLKFDLIYTFIRILDKQQKNLNLQIQEKSLEKFLIKIMSLK